MGNFIYTQARKELDKLLTEIKEYSYLCIYSAGNRAKEIVQMQKIHIFFKIFSYVFHKRLFWLFYKAFRLDKVLLLSYNFR